MKRYISNTNVEQPVIRASRAKWSYESRLKQTAIKMIEEMTLPEVMTFIKRRIGKAQRQRRKTQTVLAMPKISPEHSPAQHADSPARQAVGR